MKSGHFKPATLSILGGGPAGLAVGFYAKKIGIPFTIYEAGPRIGGNCRTLEHGEFRFDTGAHRFHARYPEITADMQGLMGSELAKIDAPSQIVYRNRFIDFPLSPLNLIRRMGVRKVATAAIDLIRARHPKCDSNNFRETAVGTYGQTIADAFLLGYSEKLWGLPADQLSPAISGKRLKGLNAVTFLKEVFKGSRTKTEHLDGSFFYPRLGIGMLMDALAEASGAENIRTRSPVTRLYHSGGRITETEVNGERIPANHVVSTLPLNILMGALSPAPPDRIIELARKIRFQNLALVVLFLNTDRVSGNASFYFPDPATPFTRASEPKNRSAEMSPPGKTSLALELPCQPESRHWSEGDDGLIRMAAQYVASIGLIKPGDIRDGVVHRIHHAYPILEVGHEVVVGELLNYLCRFENLSLIGRNSRFSYLHIHDLLLEGRYFIEKIGDQTPAETYSPSVGISAGTAECST